MEPVSKVTQLSQQYGVQGLCTEVPRASVDRRSFVRGFDIDLNVGWAEQYGGGATSIGAKNPHHALAAYDNLNPSLYLQIYPTVIETNTNGKDEFDNNGLFDHEGKDFSNI